MLDTSGSMKGEPMRRAERPPGPSSTTRPADDFSLTTFSTGARVVVPVGRSSRARPGARRHPRLKEGGNTDISAACRRPTHEALPGAERGEVVPLVLLVSDGKPTAGLREPRELSELSLRAFQAGVQTSSFGLGNAFDGPLMSAVAAEGSGAYYYLRDATEMRQALATEIDRRVDPVATALEVRVWLEQDVKLLHVYGSHRLDGDESDRVRRSEVAADRHAAQRDRIDVTPRRRRGGMRFYIPTFARDDAHAILLELSAPTRRSAPLRVGVVEVKYKDRVFGKNVFDDATIWAPYGNTVGESSASLNRSVARTVHGFQAGEAFTAAAARMARGDRRGATDLLTGAESACAWPPRPRRGPFPTTPTAWPGCAAPRRSAAARRCWSRCSSSTPAATACSSGPGRLQAIARVARRVHAPECARVHVSDRVVVAARARRMIGR